MNINLPRMNFISSAILISIISLHGCGRSGPQLGEVSGRVTVNGQPGRNLSVTFAPAVGGRPSMATTDDEGHYELLFSGTTMGAMVGEHSVSIMENPNLMASYEVKVVDGVGHVDSTAMNKQIAQQLKDRKSGKRIPTKYYQNSVLNAKVQPGDNTFDFELTF